MSSLLAGLMSLKPCPNGTTVKPSPSRFLGHLDESPAVVGNLANVVFQAELLDSMLNMVVVNHVAFGGLDESLPMPQIVGHMITRDSKIECVFWEPHGWQHPIRLIGLEGWEDEHERRDVGSGREI